MPQIAIEIAERAAATELEALAQGSDAFLSERQGMDGVALFTVILTLTPVLVGGIVKIVQAQIKAKKHVHVKVRGIEIRGVSEEALIRILKTSLPPSKKRKK